MPLFNLKFSTLQLLETISLKKKRKKRDIRFYMVLSYDKRYELKTTHFRHVHPKIRLIRRN